MLSMANTGPTPTARSSSSPHVPTPWLDGKHSVFGHVIEGMDVVYAIQKGDVMKKVTVEDEEIDASK